MGVVSRESNGHHNSSSFFSITVAYPSQDVRLQNTIIEDPRPLHSLVEREVPPNTERPIVSLLVCGSPQCQLCLGDCSQCNQCVICQTVCRNKTRGVFSRCSYCTGGSEGCHRRCLKEKKEEVCRICHSLCQLP